MARIRVGRPEGVPAVLELLDDAVQWLVSIGRTDQWGTQPLSSYPRRVALTEEQARRGELHLAVDGDLVVGALGVGDATEHVPPAVEPELYVTLLVTRRAYLGKGSAVSCSTTRGGLPASAGCGCCGWTASRPRTGRWSATTSGKASPRPTGSR